MEGSAIEQLLRLIPLCTICPGVWTAQLKSVPIPTNTIYSKQLDKNSHFINHCQNDLNTPQTYSFRFVVWLRCTIGNLIVSLSSPYAFASQAICSKMPALRISMILLKAKKLTQLAANAIIIAQRRESLAETATKTKATTRQAPQAIWQYQKTCSKEEGEAKLAQYTHTSSSLEVSTVQDACRYFLPTFLVSQNQRLEERVTKRHAICWAYASPKVKSSSKTRALAATMWRRGHWLGWQSVEVRLLEVLPLQTTDEIIIIVHRYRQARIQNQHCLSRRPYILNHSLIRQSHLPSSQAAHYRRGYLFPIDRLLPLVNLERVSLLVENHLQMAGAFGQEDLNYQLAGRDPGEDRLPQPLQNLPVLSDNHHLVLGRTTADGADAVNDNSAHVFPDKYNYE